ncbi:tail fiber protein [Pedobacter sp. WC2501]|uniref:tail fiber protein n=1 Tax=Pedobacter sp. WC2501 TaxID=3461400 RepID=UPI004045F6DF
MSQLETNQGTTLDFEIPSFYNTYNLASYGGLKIAVYKNRSADRPAYFYTPLILVDWKDYKDSLDQIEEKVPDDKKDKTIQEISIVIQHSDPLVEAEMISKIRDAQDLTNSSAVALNLLPFKFYKIYAKIGNKKVWLNEDDISMLTPDDNYTTQLTLIHERAYLLKGTFNELKYFYNNSRTNLIWANLYSDGSPYSTTTVNSIATFFNDSKNTKKIIGDEDKIQKSKIISSSSGGGFGISLGPLSVAGAQSDTVVSSETQIKRYLNRSYVSEVIRNSKSELNITIDGDVSKYTEIIKQFVDKLFENKQKIEAIVKIIDDKEIELMIDQINYASLTKENTETILKAKPVIDKNDDNKVEFTYGGISGKSDTKNNFKTQDDIEWQLKGGDILPVKIDLFLFTESQLKDEFSSLAIFINREAKKNTITPFIYPAVWLAKNQHYLTGNTTDKDNPIGSILAFAGAKEDKPDGWEICDGAIKNVGDFPELFKILGFKWGKGVDDTEFKLPDLQGQFLRGVDYTDKLNDPDVKDRKNATEEIGGVGSYQGDELRTHKHTTSLYGSTGGGVAFADPIKIASTDQGLRYKDCDTINPSGGLETRPKNAYVNFIIRMK